MHVLAHDWGSVETWEAVCEPGAEEKIASFSSISGPNLDHLGMWIRASAFLRVGSRGPEIEIARDPLAFFKTEDLKHKVERLLGRVVAA